MRRYVGVSCAFEQPAATMQVSTAADRRAQMNNGVISIARGDLYGQENGVLRAAHQEVLANQGDLDFLDFPTVPYSAIELP